VFNLAATRPDLITGPDDAPYGSVGVDINCAVIAFINQPPHRTSPTRCRTRNFPRCKQPIRVCGAAQLHRSASPHRPAATVPSSTRLNSRRRQRRVPGQKDINERTRFQ
jgi:hypothetical protein